jgi:hypothetical protein
MIKLLSAPVRFPLVQFLIVVALVVLLQTADDKTVPGEIFAVLDRVVQSSVQATASVFNVKALAQSELTVGFMFGYVYLAFWLLLVAVRFVFRLLVDLFGLNNILWTRGLIARERGAQAYRAWLPLERIRPAQIPQHQWEETYAWPPGNRPPYPAFGYRLLRGTITYVVGLVVVATLIQLFTPLPVLSWAAGAAKRMIGF